MKALLIANPGAGRMRRITPAQLAQALQERGLEVTIAAAEFSAAVALARQALSDPSLGYQRIVVAGGDGAINSLLPAFTEHPGHAVALALLPVGTVNVLARELGLPLSWPEAAVVAAQGVPRRIDLGRLNGRPFVLMAGLGFDAAAVQAIRTSVKSKLGAFAYVLNGLRLLLRTPAHTFRVTCDDANLELRAWQVVAANASRYTYRWRIAPQARIDDGRLDLCLLPELGRRRRLGQVLALLLNRPQGAAITYLSAERMEVCAEAAVPLQLDGDAFPAVETARIEVLPQALQVIVPGASEQR